MAKVPGDDREYVWLVSYEDVKDWSEEECPVCQDNEKRGWEKDDHRRHNEKIMYVYDSFEAALAEVWASHLGDGKGWTWVVLGEDCLLGQGPGDNKIKLIRNLLYR